MLREHFGGAYPSYSYMAWEVAWLYFCALHLLVVDNSFDVLLDGGRIYHVVVDVPLLPLQYSMTFTMRSLWNICSRNI